jgi:hypothetical protein
MQASGQTMQQLAQAMHLSTKTTTANWRPALFVFFPDIAKTSIGQYFTHKPHPLHFSWLIVITTILFFLFGTAFSFFSSSIYSLLFLNFKEQ